MRTHFTYDINEIGINEEQWNNLVSKNETNTIFQTYQWFQSWWRIFGDQHSLFFISVCEDEDVIGIAPLMISVNKNGKRILRFVGEGNADYCDFIIEKKREEVLRRIIDTIYAKSKEWDIVSLNNIPNYALSLKTLSRKCKSYGSSIMVTNNIACPTLSINGNRSEIIKLSKKYSLTRRYNYLRKNGRLEFMNIEDISEAKRYLELFENQHIQRWNFKGQPSLFLNSRNRLFYLELLNNLIGTGWLLFSVLKFNGHPIAFHYGFDYYSRVMWYKPSFDINFKRFSPGLVMIKYLIEYTLNNNKEELDFTIGDEPFKSRFTNNERQNTCIQIYQNKFLYLQEYVRVNMKHLVRIIFKDSVKD